jgi:pimeloyl-ACP methyl ester carboxylesterase
LRSCYASEWRFDKSDATNTTAGEYVFCPDNQPCYPGFHNLGSRNWTSSERDPEPVLGETSEARQRYTRGDGPAPFPDPILIGSPECLLDGERVQGLTPWKLAKARVDQWQPIADGLLFSFNAGVNCGGTEQFGQAGEATLKIHLNAPRRVRLVMVGRFTRAVGQCQIELISKSGWFTAAIAGPQDGSCCEMVDVSHTFDVTLPAGSDVWTLQAVDGTNCIDNTALASLAIEWPDGEPGNLAEFLDGFDTRCYLPPAIPDSLPEPNPNPYDTREWLRFSEFIVETYADMTVAAASVQAYFKGTALIDTVDNTGSIIPGSLIAWNSDMAVVLIPGTTNFQQICLQVLDPGVGLVDWGAYSAPTIWQSAYAAIQTRIAASGVDPTGPIFIAGHSYGGAVATLLAANYILFNPSRDVRLFTIGAPRAGDYRLFQCLAGIKRIHLANKNDGVTGIPAVAGELTGLSWVLPTLLYNQWTESHKMGAQVALNLDGSIEWTDDTQLNFAALIDLIIEIVNSLAIPPYVSHFSAEYVRRLKLNLGE